jgi:hypothetical protein
MIEFWYREDDPKFRGNSEVASFYNVVLPTGRAYGYILDSSVAARIGNVWRFKLDYDSRNNDYDDRWVQVSDIPVEILEKWFNHSKKYNEVADYLIFKKLLKEAANE